MFQIPLVAGLNRKLLDKCFIHYFYKTNFTWKPHLRQTRMSYDPAGSPSIMVRSFKHSEHTDHMLELTAFFTELRSTALFTCWHVNPDEQAKYSTKTFCVLCKYIVSPSISQARSRVYHGSLLCRV